MANEQRTTAEQRDALREKLVIAERDGIRWWDMKMLQCDVMEVALGLVDDADALAGALAEVSRLRRALGNVGGSISFVYDCLEGDGDSKAERMLAWIGEMVDAALAPQSGPPENTVVEGHSNVGFGSIYVPSTNGAEGPVAGATGEIRGDAAHGRTR